MGNGIGRSDTVQQPPTDEKFVSEATQIVERMKSAKVPFRIMAGCAVRIHRAGYTHLHQVKIQRNLRDIDFITLRNELYRIDDRAACVYPSI